MHRKLVALFGLIVLLAATKASAATLTRVGSVTLNNPSIGPLAVSFAAPYAYVLGTGGLAVIDATNPTAPVLVTTLASVAGVDIVRWGKYLLVGWGYQLTVVDVSNPAQPAVVSTAAISIGARALAVSGHHVFAVGGLGMSSIDLSDPLAPVEVGTLAFPAQAEGIAIYGNHALVADREGGLQVVDISRPAAPVAVAALNLGNLAFDVVVSGTLAYVTTHGWYCDEEWCGDNPGALHVVDVFDPTAPRVVGTLARNRAPETVYVHGTYVFFVERWTRMPGDRNRLVAADVSNPAAPIAVSEYNIYYDLPMEMATAGSYLFVPGTSYQDVSVFRLYP